MGRKPSLLTSEQLEAFRAEYPTTTNAVLCQRYGLSFRQCMHLQHKLGVVKVDSARAEAHMNADSIRAQIVAFIASCGPAGASLADVREFMRLGNERITHWLARLVELKRIHRANPYGTRGMSRWFSSPALASAFSTSVKLGTWKDSKAEERARAFDERQAARQREADERRRLLALPVTRPEGLEVEVGRPAPMSRWEGLQIAPGGFSSLKPGQYLDERPKTWVAIAANHPEQAEAA